MELYFQKAENNSELMECKFEEMEENLGFNFQSTPLTWQPEFSRIKALTDGVCTRAVHDTRYVRQPSYNTCITVERVNLLAILDVAQCAPSRAIVDMM
jgi:hypothetical protein